MADALCPSATGAFAQLTLALCGNNGQHKVYWPWYCGGSKAAKGVRDVATGILPAVLLVVWQAVLLPRLLYYVSQVQPHPYLPPYPIFCLLYTRLPHQLMDITARLKCWLCGTSCDPFVSAL